LLEEGEERVLSRWIECGLGGYLIANGRRIVALMGRLEELMAIGYGLFPRINKDYARDVLYTLQSQPFVPMGRGQAN